jgi:hypothetical protein
MVAEKDPDIQMPEDGLARFAKGPGSAKLN